MKRDGTENHASSSYNGEGTLSKIILNRIYDFICTSYKALYCTICERVIVSFVKFSSETYKIIYDYYRDKLKVPTTSLLV